MTAKTDIGNTEDSNAVSVGYTAMFGDLSPDAKQAVAWLFSDHARKLSVLKARACILEGWGKRVDDELRAYFSPNVPTQRRGAAWQSTHNSADSPRPLE